MSREGKRGEGTEQKTSKTTGRERMTEVRERRQNTWEDEVQTFVFLFKKKYSYLQSFHYKQ